MTAKKSLKLTLTFQLKRGSETVDHVDNVPLVAGGTVKFANSAPGVYGLMVGGAYGITHVYYVGDGVETQIGDFPVDMRPHSDRKLKFTFDDGSDPVYMNLQFGKSPEPSKEGVHISVWEFPSMLNCYALVVNDAPYVTGGLSAPEMKEYVSGKATIIGFSSMSGVMPWLADDGKVMVFKAAGGECSAGERVSFNAVFTRCP